jgi:hypothetical protein
MTLTNFPFDPLLDLAPWMGQRQCTYRFNLINGASGENLGTITPIRTATLTHDTSRVIKRQLNLAFGRTDAAAINPITDQVAVTMVFPNGAEYPLGRFLFTDATYQRFTIGVLSNTVLNDHMYIVDQPIERGFGSRLISNSILPPVSRVILEALVDLPIKVEIEYSSFLSTDSWSIGARRGQIIETLALVGDYFSPWFDFSNTMRFIRSFDPAKVIPDFDWDAGNQVMRNSITESANVLNAPNRFVVTSNSAINPDIPTFGSVDVPANAPNSFEKRGFRLVQVTNLQATSSDQCVAIARNLMERQNLVQTTTLTTAPDPRHDSYNVVKWQDAQWLELSWALPLQAGEPMTHTLRRSFT